MKNPRFLAPITFCFVLVFFACNQTSSTQKNVEDNASSTPAPVPDNSSNSLDWSGSYKGIVPCADCEGIETEILLNTDKTYILRIIYKGKDKSAHEARGSFTWNEAGNTITLEGLQNQATQYFVGENTLTQLDMSGNKITGDLASKYVLQKQQNVSPSVQATSVAIELTETYWKLIELRGKAIEETKEGEKELFITLKKQDSRFAGYAGCNNFNGKYEVKEGNQIKFSAMASTLKACPEMSIEDELTKILQQADNYAIAGNKLSLNRAKMAPLARFEASTPK